MRQRKETPDFLRIWAASRPISRMATREYRPSGITTAVTGVKDGPARTGAARRNAALSIKNSAQRTSFSVTIPSTKRGLELTRLRNDYTLRLRLSSGPYSYYRYCRQIQPASVFNWLLRLINHQNVHRAFLAFQLEP